MAVGCGCTWERPLLAATALYMAMISSGRDWMTRYSGSTGLFMEGEGRVRGRGEDIAVAISE